MIGVRTLTVQLAGGHLLVDRSGALDKVLLFQQRIDGVLVQNVSARQRGRRARHSVGGSAGESLLVMHLCLCVGKRVHTIRQFVIIRKMGKCANIVWAPLCAIGAMYHVDAPSIEHIINYMPM